MLQNKKCITSTESRKTLYIQKSSMECYENFQVIINWIVCQIKINQISTNDAGCYLMKEKQSSGFYTPPPKFMKLFTKKIHQATEFRLPL